MAYARCCRPPAFSSSTIWPFSAGTATGPGWADVFGRALKVSLLDLPLAQLSSTLIHEVFGHGARARESGLQPSFRFTLPLPYRIVLDPDTSHGGFTNRARTGHTERDLVMLLGGIEANHLTAWALLHDQILPRQAAHYGESLLYLESKLSYATTMLFDLHAPDSGGASDPHNYVQALQQRFNRWRPSERRDIAAHLRAAWLWTLSDPMLWISLYNVVVGHIYQGRRFHRPPQFALGSVRLFPATRFNLSPFGPEHYIDLFATHRGVLWSLYGRIGSGGLARHGGGGLRFSGHRLARGLHLGGAIDVWRQPETLYRHRNVFTRPDRVGIGTDLRLRWRAFGRIGLVGKLGAKSAGYLMGQPVGGGLYGYLGFALSPRSASVP